MYGQAEVEPQPSTAAFETPKTTLSIPESRGIVEDKDCSIKKADREENSALKK
jgi:hypothetical protein